jgi:hypothetical protein
MCLVPENVSRYVSNRNVSHRNVSKNIFSVSLKAERIKKNRSFHAGEAKEI